MRRGEEAFLPGLGSAGVGRGGTGLVGRGGMGLMGRGGTGLALGPGKLRLKCSRLWRANMASPPLYTLALGPGGQRGHRPELPRCPHLGVTPAPQSRLHLEPQSRSELTRPQGTAFTFFQSSFYLCETETFCFVLLF